MGAKEYKLENVLGKLVKELRDNKYLVHSYTQGHPDLTFEIYKDDPENPYRCHSIGRINVADEPDGVEMTLLIYGGSFLKDKGKVLSIAKKYLEKHKTPNKSQ
ncbi:MAG: hypothetical protein Q8O03_06260 [Nanoarchaeota archaeon]|nr:hypothetical protein [Nanoarchaeota archaeon]